MSPSTTQSTGYSLPLPRPFPRVCPEVRLEEAAPPSCSAAAAATAATASMLPLAPVPLAPAAVGLLTKRTWRSCPAMRVDRIAESAALAPADNHHTANPDSLILILRDMVRVWRV